MKRIFVLLVFVLAVGLSTVIAGNGADLPAKIRESLMKEFPNAESVNWNDRGKYQEAAFILNNERMQAFFDTDGGALVGFSRDLRYTQLPLAVLRSFNERFTGAHFTNALEVCNVEGTSYRLTVLTGTRIYRVKADNNGMITEIKRIKVRSKEDNNKTVVRAETSLGI